MSTASPRTATVPATLLDGRFAVLRALGVDACGPIVLATEKATNATVAVQYLPASHPEYDDCLARFHRVVEVSRLVQHPNLVAARDATVDGDGNACLIMEFVDGPSLRAVLDETGALPANRALAIAHDVARALEALHARDVTHQALAPARILLTKEGMAKITGLGDAQIGRASPFTYLGARHPGVPGYASPEQESGLGGIDGRSDLYSLGAILYEMLAGEPYSSAGRSLTLVRPDVTPATVVLVNRLLERQPAFRYATAAEVAHDLDGILHPPLPETGSAPHMAQGTPAVRSPAETPPMPVPPVAAPSSVSFPVPPAAVPARPVPVPPPPMTFAPSPVVPPPPVQMPPWGQAPQAPPWQPPTGMAPPAASVPVGQNSQGGAQPIFRPPPSYGGAVPPIPQTRQAVPRKGKVPWGGIIAVIVAVLVLRSAFSNASTPRVPPTPTRIPATRTAVAAALTATAAQPIRWSDPKGRINLRLPPGWRAVLPSASAKPEEIVTLVGPAGVQMAILASSPTGTLDDQFAAERRSQNAVTTRTYTQGPLTPATIGGEPGKYMEFHAVWAPTYSAGGSSAAYAPYSGVEWIVDHAGKRFFFIVVDTKTSRAACDTIVASVTFPT